MRVIALEIDLLIASDVWSQLVPGDEAQISVRALVSNKIFLAFQNVVQNHGDSLDLVSIAILCRLDLFGMEIVEPVITLIRVELTAVAFSGDLPG